MTLYSTPLCLQSHSCRIVLFEKEVECQIEYIDPVTGKCPHGLAP